MDELKSPIPQHEINDWTLHTMRLKSKKPSKTDFESSINWEAVPTKLKNKMIEHDMMPKRGIPKVIHSSGPYEPEYFSPYNLKYMPEGTIIKYLNYEELDASVLEISKELEKLEIFGGY
jgi:hypothetical protein